MSKDPMSMLSFILGNESKTTQIKNQKTQKVSRSLIINSAMFWDSKKRVQKIKTLFLNGLGLIQFDDTQDFKVQQLQSIELLSLCKNNIIHLHPLSNLQSLISLNVSNNRVYDLNPLTKLIKLSELYAANNQIKNIQPLEGLGELKILQLYKNLIKNKQETFNVLVRLMKLEEVDVQENEVCQEEFVQALRGVSSLKKINGNLNKNTQKIKQMSSSKGFNLTSRSLATSTMFFNSSNPSNFINSNSTFYNFTKKKSLQQQNLEQKQNQIRKLQSTYTQLDDQFQQEIVKNVRMKTQLYKLIQNKKVSQRLKENQQYQKQEIKNLKRKVKAMKQQLFTKDKKGELLRKLFEFELMMKKRKTTNNDNDSITHHKNNNVNVNSKGQNIKKQSPLLLEEQIVWSRRFEADEIIVIEKNDKYLMDEEEQINHMLGDFQDTLKEIKSELDYLS